MASPAYPLFAFHALDARITSRTPLSLDAVEDLYEQYLAAHPRSSTKTSSVTTGSSGSAGSAGSPNSDASTPSTGSTTSLHRQARGKFPLFVTWNKRDRRGEKQLRGCIGTFDEQELGKGIRTYAVTAALEDTRFRPITPADLPALQASITLLMDFEPCSAPLDWVLGEHGIRISFYWHGRRCGATFLPSVAPEQGWDKEETLVALMRKAGWNGRAEEWEGDAEGLRVVRYRGESVKCEWEEYVAWRQWVDAR